MAVSVALVIKILAAATLLGDAFIVVWLLAHAFTDAARNPFTRFARHANLGALVVSLGAVVGSIFLSWTAGFEPCVLCWWQRVFMFPVPILLAMGMIKRDRGVADYVLGLALPGAFVALYHTYLQYGGTAFASCASISGGASCITRFVFEFGFVTIPLMTLTAFGLIIIAMVSQKIGAAK